MQPMLVVHIFAGCLALISGYVALYAAKGATLHRQSGILFVYAILAMSLLGMVISAERNVAPAVNIPVGLLTSYLVITALMTVRGPVAGSRWLNPALMLVALTIGLTNLAFAFEAIANGGRKNDVPAFPFVMFAVVGLLASAGDLRMIRSGPLQGAPRLARHLWRMSFALFIAALSFPRVIPKSIRSPGLLALPVLAVLVPMLYWLWRVRRRRNLRSAMAVSAPAPGLLGHT